MTKATHAHASRQTSAIAPASSSMVATSCHAPRRLYGPKHLPLVLALFLLLVGGAQGALPAGCCTAAMVAKRNAGCLALGSRVPNNDSDCGAILDVVTSFSVNLPTRACLVVQLLSNLIYAGP